MARVLTRLRKKTFAIHNHGKKKSASNFYVNTLKKIVIPLLLYQKLAHQPASACPLNPGHALLSRTST